MADRLIIIINCSAVRHFHLTIDWKNKYTFEPWSRYFRGVGWKWTPYFRGGGGGGESLLTFGIYERPKAFVVTSGTRYFQWFTVDNWIKHSAGLVGE